MMCPGVLKSGSPAPKDTTDSPAAFMAFALAVIASVSDGAMEEILEAILCFISVNLFRKNCFFDFKRV